MTVVRGKPEDIAAMGVDSIVRAAYWEARIGLLQELAMIARSGVPITLALLEEMVEGNKVALKRQTGGG